MIISINTEVHPRGHFLFSFSLTLPISLEGFVSQAYEMAKLSIIFIDTRASFSF